MSRLLADARNLLAQLDEGQEIDADRLGNLIRRIRVVAGGLPQSELRELITLTQSLEDAVRKERDAIAAQISKTGAHRRALRGYGQLRSHGTAQRVNCKT